mmetsp:Transcript_134150/g.189537  ORF Transcript_134150/g.189537 Transcript_134150/m.189537 type:complete len:347 (+) Transcript_134150:61-1101(+)
MPASQRGALRLGLGEISCRRTEDRIAVLIFLGQHEVELCQLLAYIIRHLRMAACREVHHREAVAFEILHLVRCVPVKQRQVLRDVQGDLLVVRKRLEIRGLVVLRPHRKRTARELTESLDHRRAEIVSVAVPPRCVVAVQVQARELEVLRLSGKLAMQPSRDDLCHVRVLSGRARHNELSAAIPQQAQRVALHPLLALWHDVDPERVLGECPALENPVDVVAADCTLFLLRLGHDLPCRAVGNQTVGSHPHRLVAPLLQVQLPLFEVAPSAKLPHEPVHDGSVDVRQLPVVLDLAPVNRLLADMAAQHLDEAVLIVVDPVDGVGSQRKALADSFGLGILLIADVGL